jgi:hypothetical protein
MNFSGHFVTVPRESWRRPSGRRCATWPSLRRQRLRTVLFFFRVASGVFSLGVGMVKTASDHRTNNPVSERRFLLIWSGGPQISARQATYSVLPGADQFNFLRWQATTVTNGPDVRPLRRRFAGETGR